MVTAGRSYLLPYNWDLTETTPSGRWEKSAGGAAAMMSCLAIHTGLTMQQAAAAVTALGRLAEFAVSLAPCLSCGRTNTLISATAA